MHFFPSEDTKLSSAEFANKWKSIPKQSEQHLILGKLLSIENFVNQLKKENINICLFKRIDSKLFLYLSAITKDNSVILSELTLIKNDFIYAKIKYRSESNVKEIEYENLFAVLIRDGEEEKKEDVICR